MSHANVSGHSRASETRRQVLALISREVPSHVPLNIFEALFQSKSRIWGQLETKVLGKLAPSPAKLPCGVVDLRTRVLR